jgi:hypothetical protein
MVEIHLSNSLTGEGPITSLTLDFTMSYPSFSLKLETQLGGIDIT